ncbi:hypothetical protein LL3_03290 [Bacillus amyloliquefaciens LL3]|nr:hypothetical protein LL3_03290 [Bacillus amyloliquefaciens LL3]
MTYHIIILFLQNKITILYFYNLVYFYEKINILSRKYDFGTVVKEDIIQKF